MDPISTLSPINSQQICKKLKVFDLIVPWISVGLMVKYITAPGLDEFKLDATGDAFDVWVQDADREELEGLKGILRATRQIRIDMNSGLYIAESRKTEVFSIVEQISTRERLTSPFRFSPPSTRNKR